MDAQSADVGSTRRTRMDQMKFSGEVQQLRSDMLEVEDKIVEDIDRLKELLTPDRVANYIFLLLGEELLDRVKEIEWPKFEEVGNIAKKSIKDHRLLSALLGLGVSGLLFYGLWKHQANGGVKAKGRLEVLGVHGAKDRQYN